MIENQSSYIDYTPVQEDVSVKLQLKTCWRYPLYYITNLVAAIIHLLNFIVFNIIHYSLNKDVLYNITTGYVEWSNIEPNKFIIVPQKKIIGYVSLHNLIIMFHLISFAFQMVVMIPIYQYKHKIEVKGINPLRFVEYSLSAPLMLVSIGLLSGITDLFILLLMCVLTSICMFCGALCEVLPKRHFFKRLITHLIGWLSILAAYSPIFTYFFMSNAEAVDGAPKFVYVIVILQFILFQSFGIVQLIQLYFINCKIIGVIGRESEVSYTLLSLISKTILGWMIYANIFLLGN